MRYILIGLCCCWMLFAEAQTDSVVLTFEQYLEQVYTNHPLAKRANLQRQEAAAYLQKAKGGFDPKIGTTWDYKEFKEKTYFNIFNAYLKVPIWSDIELEGGYNHANGYYLNPEQTLPDVGQAYLGVKIPLLQGLLTSERRIVLQQARLLESASEAEIQTALNNLLYTAGKKYWDWTKSYNELLVIQQSLVAAQQQLSATRASFIQGDKPAIDTLKDFIQVQERQVLLANSRVAFQNYRRAVSGFLWDVINNPLLLEETVYPVVLQQLNTLPLEEVLLENSLELLEDHPDLVAYDYKLQGLALKRRLNSNKLLPKLNVKYNFLSVESVDFFGTEGVAPIENYKLGLEFSMPLFLRKERAELALTDLKLRATEFQLDNKQRDLRIKLENYFNEVQIFAAQTQTLEQMVNNYSILLEAERIKLNLGESSVFLVNVRQNQLLEAQRKLIKQQVKYLKARMAFFWVTATLSGNDN
ncbi:MAG: TolC family protein [Aureispira sp.]